MKILTTVIAACLVLTACASTPKTSSPLAEQSAVQSAVQPKATTNPQIAIPSEAEIDAKKLAEQLQYLKNKSVYFDFDKSIVKPEYHDVVQQQSDFIKAHGNDTVTLEGNCDERGSDEYNLALGDRRANAVRKVLEILGVSADQMKTVSFGEEKPRLTCHEEKCWQENRRVDFDHKLNP
jgi:peptidoglycan-associated lipoprotein